ncbi:hypothetical protein FRB93_012491 [Tulasnella sp. JGI-2019a]|nr:hypothetical protein FRB93_012491 [Tulasnella sp. JGI-2019a]
MSIGNTNYTTEQHSYSHFQLLPLPTPFTPPVSQIALTNQPTQLPGRSAAAAPFAQGTQIPIAALGSCSAPIDFSEDMPDLETVVQAFRHCKAQDLPDRSSAKGVVKHKANEKTSGPTGKKKHHQENWPMQFIH